MLKKAFSIILSLCLLLCLASCGKDKSKVKVGEYEVPIGVYNYYYDTVKDNDDPEGDAVKKCESYIGVNLLMEKLGLNLSTTRKSEGAEKAEKQWGMFASYYEGIGVTKQDINKIMTNEMGKIELLHYYYGTGGKKEVGETQLRKELDKTYVGFKAIEAELYKLNDIGESVELSSREKSALKKELTAIAARVNSGADPDSENVTYNEKRGLIVTQQLSLNIIKEDDPLYSDEFFKAVSKLSYGEAAVIECAGKLYMLQRQRIDNNDEVFALYADKVLEGMKMGEVEKMLEKMNKE